MLQDNTSWLNKNAGTILNWVIFLIAIYFPLFLDLSTLPLRIWDEARLAENAYEMNKFGHYLIPHIRGAADMWNTKPPLMIWLQVFFMKLNGINELSVRLPSAIAAALTCILLALFTTKIFKNFWQGFAAALVLVSSFGYIDYHAARNGDYDALLTLFTTLYCLSFFAYTISRNTKYLTLTFIGIILAVFTKSVQGLLFLPALAVYALLKGEAPKLLRDKSFYINLATSILLIIGYYLLRNHYNPGYINAVINNELGGRYMATIEGHSGGFWYYIQNLDGYKFHYWLLLVPVGLIIGLANKDSLVKNFSIYLLILSLSYLLVISIAKTKLDWYDVPLYPFFGLIIASLLPLVSALIKSFEKVLPVKQNILLFVCLSLVFYYPYRSIINDTYGPHEISWDQDKYRIEYYLKQAIDGARSLNDYHLCYSGYSVQNLFYVNILNDKGQKIDIIGTQNIRPGEKIIVCQQAVEDSVLNKFNCTFLNNFWNVKTYQVNTIKSN